MIKKYVLLFYETSYLNEEVNRTEPSLSVSIPCQDLCPNLASQIFSLFESDKNNSLHDHLVNFDNFSFRNKL